MISAGNLPRPSLAGAGRQRALTCSARRGGHPPGLRGRPLAGDRCLAAVERTRAAAGPHHGEGDAVS